MKTLILAVLLLMILVSGCQTTPDGPTPPIAKIEPTVFQEFGHERVDNYYWLREREDQEVLDYLHAENAYSEAKLAHTDDLQQTLFDEIVGRIKKNDDSVPYLDRGYWYYSRFEEGHEYPFY